MKNFSLIRKQYDPFAVEEVGRLVDELWKRPFPLTLAAKEVMPVVDIYEKDNRIVVKADIPGIESDAVKVSVEGNFLTISGEKKEEQETKKDAYYYLERSFGKFQRSIELPTEVKIEEAKATYEKGVLRIEIPKAASRTAKEITIEHKK